jgi:putative membrane protein
MPTTLTTRHRLATAGLAAAGAAKGPEFDRAFLQHEVAYHKAVIDAVTQTLLPAIQNQEVKDLVTRVAPAFQAHMTAAQQKLDALKSTASR